MARMFTKIQYTLPLFGLLALAACSTAPPPTDGLDRAQAQVESARAAGARDYAPVDLGFAEQKLDAAKAAMASKKYGVAADLADEAGVAGELARARAQLAKLRAEVQDRTAENARLRADVLERAAAAPAAAVSAPAPASSSEQLPQIELGPAPASSTPAPAGSQGTTSGGQP